jgi:asparaginyl-tRNA synthetase
MMDKDVFVNSAMMPPLTYEVPDEHFLSAIQHPWYKLIFRLMGVFTQSSFDFFRCEGLYPALMPVTCQSISSPMGLGSDSLPVQIALFGSDIYLADSMQFQLEYLLRHHEQGVWYIMPSFRGEEPDSRHLNQFFHAEAEIRGGLADVMSLVARYITACTTHILQHCGEDIQRQAGSVSHIEHLLSFQGVFPCIRFQEAVTLLGDNPLCFTEPHPGIVTLSSYGENELVQKFGGVVWLTHPPANSVPFYQALSKDNYHAECADLLMGIGEVVGCGERHSDQESTRLALKLHEVDEADYGWYLKMKEAFPIRTAGFGLGIERYLLWVLKHNDIRQIPLFSRLKGCDSYP